MITWVKKTFFSASFFLLLGSLGFSFGMLELGIRVLERTTPNTQPKTPRPHYYYKQASTGSFANYKFSIEKPPRIYRIGMVGDSFTYPTLMQLDDTYSKRLERMLNLDMPFADYDRVEVINYGQSGLSSFQELGQVKRAIEAQCDLVVLQITLNDIQLDNFHKISAKLADKYTLGELTISKEETPWLYYFHSLGFIAQRIHNWKTHSSFVQYNLDLYERDNDWHIFKTSIQNMKKMTRKANIKFAAFVMPFFHFPLDAKYPFAPIHEKINTMLKRQHIKGLDMYERFSGIPVDLLQVLPGQDSHPNEIAHRIISEELLLWLEKEQIIPEPLTHVAKYQSRKPLVPLS